MVKMLDGQKITRTIMWNLLACQLAGNQHRPGSDIDNMSNSADYKSEKVDN